MFSYRLRFIPNKIIVIGCGGTGSRLVPLLTQFIKTCSWVQNPEILLADFDIVEDKNLSRQNFIQQDVGKNKAVVLAQRYSRAFGVPITAHEHKFGDNSKSNAFTSFLSRHGTGLNNTAIFICVDSVQARKDIITTIASYGNANFLIMDSGNEDSFGQVYIANGVTGSIYDTGYFKTIKESYKKLMPKEIFLEYMPLDTSYFMDMKESKGASCADLDQTMAINALMANSMFGIFQHLMYANAISFNRLNISLNSGSTPVYMDLENLNEIAMQSRTRNDTFGFVRYDYDKALKEGWQAARKLSEQNKVAELEAKQKEHAFELKAQALLKENLILKRVVADLSSLKEDNPDKGEPTKDYSGSLATPKAPIAPRKKLAEEINAI